MRTRKIQRYAVVRALFEHVRRAGRLGGPLALLALQIATGCTDGPAAPGGAQLSGGSVATLANATPSAATLLAHDVTQGLAEAQVGELLYRADPEKRNGYSYCRESGQLADRGEFRAAVDAALKGLFLGVGTGDHRLAADAARDIGYAYELAGSDAAATIWAREALRQMQMAHLADDVAAEVEGPAHKTLGDVALRQGRLEEARAEYVTALARSMPQFQPIVLAATANVLARLGDKAGAEAALRDARDGAPWLHAYHDRLAAEIALLSGDTAGAISGFTAAADAVAEVDTPYNQMWALVGLARAQHARGDDASARASYARAFAVADEVRARFRSEEFKAGLFGDLQAAFDEAVDLAWDAGDRIGAFGIAEQGRSRAFLDMIGERVPGRAAVAVPVASLASLEAAVPPLTALVVYDTDAHATRAWVVRHDGVTPVGLSPSGAELAALVARLRLQIANGDDAEPARALYADLIAPLALRRGEALIVVPHGVLHRLPFQALQGAAGRLIEERGISYLPTASALTAGHSAEQGPLASMLALADPDLGNPAYDLPGAEAEGRRVAAIIGAGADLRLRKQATGAALIESGPGHAALHIASHALVDEIDPLASRVLLADGAVQARQFYLLDLSRTRLVVLSACETGLGSVARADEFYGFERTVLASGAAAMLASLWEVSDESTAALMAAFYERLQAGDPASVALRAAMLRVMADPRFHAPRFWAAFDLVGRAT